MNRAHEDRLERLLAQATQLPNEALRARLAESAPHYPICSPDAVSSCPPRMPPPNSAGSGEHLPSPNARAINSAYLAHARERVQDQERVRALTWWLALAGALLVLAVLAEVTR